MDWSLLGFVKASIYRTQIILSLSKSKKTPKELKTELGLYITHISSTLNDLVTKGLVICLTPELKKGKIFALTELGESIAEQLE